VGGGFENTKELHVMKYKQAMKSKDKDMWDEAVFEEHKRMVKSFFGQQCQRRKCQQKPRSCHLHRQ
jgi:hypothetical protein